MQDRILRGAKPGDIPVEQPTKFELERPETLKSFNGRHESTAPDAKG